MQDERTGECNQCGKCCDIERVLGIVAIFKEHGVEFVMPDTFPCNHCVDGKCEIYDTRPQHCRDWPLKQSDLFGYPECSYKFKEKDEEHPKSTFGTKERS